jgi:hypothetical protein
MITLVILDESLFYQGDILMEEHSVQYDHSCTLNILNLFIYKFFRYKHNLRPFDYLLFE